MGVLDFILPYVFHATILGVIALEVVGLARFYYIQDDEWKYSYYCIFHTIYFFASDIPIFWAFSKAKYTDPGRIIPSPEDVDRLKNHQVYDVDDTCLKCGVVRNERHIHHCSRCKHCTLEMDHHCAFTDNCIGKHNLRYFIQFTMWTAFTCISGII